MTVLNLARIGAKMNELKGWSLDGNALVKETTFDGFMKAIEYVNKVADASNKFSHFPDVIVLYSTVRLTLITRNEHGLTDIDFEVAKEIDRLEVC